jgi:hypothetical protein
MSILILASSCLESAECVKSGDTTLEIDFKKLSGGKADTVALYYISAAGSDSVFYKTNPDVLKHVLNPVLVSVNPYADETELTFVLETGPVTLRVGYQNEVRFISEECGSDRVQRDLTVLETQFDSVKVVNSVLTKDRLTNIEIYN